MSENFGSEKGSLWSGALRSCIARFDSNVDSSKLEFYEFPSFVATVSDGLAHVLVGSIVSADIGPYLAFASRRQATGVNIYVSPAALSSMPASATSEVMGALSLQGEGFTIPVKVLGVDGTSLISVTALSGLKVVVQDESAGLEFLSHQGASDAVDLVLGCGCEVLFIRDQMIATYLGLEVARSTHFEGRVVLEIGVGRNDRMAKTWLGNSKSQTELLNESIGIVKRFRVAASEFHPLAKLSIARWIRLVLKANPGLIEAKRVVPIELARDGTWPNRNLWSLKPATDPRGEDGDSLMYRGFDPSFEDDGLSFALAAGPLDDEYLVAVVGGIDLGAVAKLYEVARSLHGQGRRIKGSILVMEDRNKILPIERLVDLAKFDLRSATILPTWKVIDRD